MSRPRLYHLQPALIDRLAADVRAGASFHAAAAARGIPETTWYRWRRQERAGDRELGAILRRLDRMRAAWREARGWPTFAEWEASDPELRDFLARVDGAARDP